MSRHHWMYFGCQCSSARCSRLLSDRLTLLGIDSAEIINASLHDSLGALPVEFGSSLLPVYLQRAFLAHGIRPLEDPVLPRRQAAEDFRLHRLRPGETEIRFEP